MTTHFSPPREITLLKRNNTFLYIFLLSMPAFLIIGLVFLILYLMRIPMTINEVERTFADLEYQRFFFVFALVVVSPFLIGIPIYLIYRTKAVDTRIDLSTNDDLEPFLYVEEKKRIVYVDSNRRIILDKKTDRIDVTTDPHAIKDEKTAYLFWYDMQNRERFKIRKKQNGFRISYFLRGNRGVKSHVFNIRTDDMGKIVSFRQRISSRSGTKNSTQGFYGYRRLETKKPRLDARIRKTLESETD